MRFLVRKINVKTAPRNLRYLKTSSSCNNKECCKDKDKDPLNEPPVNPLTEQHQEGGALIPRLVSLLFGIPFIAFFSIYLYLFGEEAERPPFIPYSYLRIRTKKYPWGDGNHSLFHNPKRNALPEGYETDEEQ